jgi:hypothetical protein
MKTMKACRRLLTAALLLSLGLTASAMTHYLDVNGTNAQPQFLATNIQGTLAAAVAGQG